MEKIGRRIAEKAEKTLRVLPETQRNGHEKHKETQKTVRFRLVFFLALLVVPASTFSF
jgi:hypothetical protein